MELGWLDNEVEMKEMNQIIEELIILPRKFNSLNNLSFYALLKDTGYDEISDKISAQKIRDALIRHPDCIDEWKQYSEDQRSSSGFFFEKEGDEHYIVGFLSENKGYENFEKYSDRFSACAIFIKLEIDAIIKS
jgi:hypothetical protein